MSNYKALPQREFSEIEDYVIHLKEAGADHVILITSKTDIYWSGHKTGEYLHVLVLQVIDQDVPYTATWFSTVEVAGEFGEKRQEYLDEIRARFDAEGIQVQVRG